MYTLTLLSQELIITLSPDFQWIFPDSWQIQISDFLSVGPSVHELSVPKTCVLLVGIGKSIKNTEAISKCLFYSQKKISQSHQKLIFDFLLVSS